MLGQRTIPKSGPVDENGFPEQDDPWEHVYTDEATQDRKPIPRIMQDQTEREAWFLHNR